MKTPVALLIFNRLDTTERVFEAIRQAKPPKLLVVADGPRPDKPEDREKCSAVRAIIDRVDWNCEILKNYSDVNLGCGRRPATGITWVFEQVQEAIILEDDCLPNPNFFQFCDVMLDRYREDERIMMITGTNFLGEWKSNIQSYHFSYYGGSWGWASWRRAWKYFDYELKLWGKTEIRERVRDVLASEEQFKAREPIYSMTYKNPENISWWDYQWGFARLVQSGLSVVPAVNLIRNIGFSEEATHTISNIDELSIKTGQLNPPYQLNEFTSVDRAFDRQLYNKLIKRKGRLVRLKNRLINMLFSRK